MGTSKRRLVLSMGIALMVFSAVLAWNPQRGYQQAEAATDYRQLQKFSQVMELIRRSYVKEVSDEELIDGALEGMLTHLDPHSTYLNKEMYKEMQVDTSGEFGGIGIEITAAEGGIRIVAPIEDTPGDRAGLQAGDLIIKIDDVLAKDLSLPEAVKRMRGKPGTTVVLTIFREGVDAPFEVKIVRDKVHVKSVKSDFLSNDFAYLRITQFQEKTADMLLEQIRKLEKKRGGPLAGAVLDLRNDPGGLLDEAVKVADLFLDKGVIVSTKSRVGKNLTFEATPGDVLRGKPLIVLINQGTASASEIVSGALQDHHRAVLLGMRSFGKGSVQSVVPLSDGTAVKLTTALYYTPSGRSIQATGIEPDIKVEPVSIKPAEEKPRLPVVLERDLRGHLANGNGKKASGKKKEDVSLISEQMRKRLSVDVQLQRALDLLKGLHALRP
ncbi:MAG: S41 family peptidase [Zetaproteobacteria bacterium]|nr:MAG: S41 family peptidase [Zetaproteobacteria bacterium]